MDANNVLARTDKGDEELETRRYELDLLQRLMLILVNGRLTAGQLAAKLEPLEGAPRQLEQLIEQGFVREVPSSPG